jgi:hypothetical protein
LPNQASGLEKLGPARSSAGVKSESPLDRRLGCAMPVEVDATASAAAGLESLLLTPAVDDASVALTVVTDV